MRRSVIGISALVLISLAGGLYTADWYLGRNHLSVLKSHSFCSIYVYAKTPDGFDVAKRRTRMYLEGVSFSEAEQLIAKELPTWRHHHNVHPAGSPYIFDEANFEPPGKWRPVVELSDVHNRYGEHFLVVSEVQDLSWFDVLLVHLTTLESDPMDETDLHFLKMTRKPYAAFPRGQSWALDQKLDGRAR